MKANSCVVVTGANGLAGSAIVEELNKDHTCIIGMTRKDADLRNSEEVVKYFDRVCPDIVIHCAAKVYGLGGNIANQGKSFFENTMINTNVIRASEIFGVKKIIAMGTNAIYPWPCRLPYQENDIWTGPPDKGEAGYGHAKRHMLAMLETYDIPFTYLVSGNLYGPRDTFNTETGHVLPSLIKKFYDAVQGGPARPWGTVNVWGDGSASRDFLHSWDLARIVRLMLYAEGQGAINIGSGDRRSIEYICKMLCNISGLDYSHVRYDTSKPTGRPHCYSDLSRLSALGFQRDTPFHMGLKQTFDWYAQKRAESPAASASS